MEGFIKRSKIGLKGVVFWWFVIVTVAQPISNTKQCNCGDTEQYDEIKRSCINPCNTANCSDFCSFNSTLSDVVTCDCPTGYNLTSDLITCQDINECQENSTICSSGDGNSHCVNINGTFDCRCNTGYHNSTATLVCTDVDECSERTTNLCTQGCVNTPPGGYSCTCDLGYALDPADMYQCLDVDECQGNHTCSIGASTCVNTIGGYWCNCSAGYEKQYDNGTCVNVNECKLGTVNCVNATCVDTPGDYKCDCHPGYSQVNKTVCEDVDECEDYPCSHYCTNTPGSYSCSCETGWHVNLTHTNTCVREPWNTCDQICVLPINERQQCVCYCDLGYLLNRDRTTCDDIDECAVNNVRCGPHSTCVNKPGHYLCKCHEGYQKDWSRRCVDIDECSIPEHIDECNKLPNKECVNSPGNHSCDCKEGYEEDANKICIQINECDRGTSGCEQDCVDTAGSYHCKCWYGYKLQPNQKNCTSIECGEPVFPDCTSTPECSEVHMSCNDTTYSHNSNCSLSCNTSAGYSLEVEHAGKDHITCTDQSRWSDLNVRCMCRRYHTRVSLNTTRIPQTATYATHPIEVLLQRAECQPVYDLLVSMEFTSSGLAETLKYLVFKQKGSQYSITPDITKAIACGLRTTKPEYTLHFDLVINHTLYNETERVARAITVYNVPEPPTIQFKTLQFIIQDDITNVAKFASIYDTDYDNIEQCTITPSEYFEIQIHDYTNKTDQKLRMELDLFVKEKYKNFGGIADELLSDKIVITISCSDDSPAHLNTSKTNIATVTQTAIIVEKLVLTPNEIYISPQNQGEKYLRFTASNANDTDAEADDFKVIFNEDGSTITTVDDTVRDFKPSDIFEIDNGSKLLKIKAEQLQKLDFGTYSINVTTKQISNTKIFTVGLKVIQSEAKTSNEELLVAISATIGITFGIVIFVSCYVFKQKRKDEVPGKTIWAPNEIYGLQFKDYHVDLRNLEIDKEIVLGRGNFGVVYYGQARCLKRDKGKAESWVPVAVKELNVSGGDLDHARAFKKEVEALTAFKHRNIISLYGIGIDDSGGETFILMEYMDQGSLKDFLVKKDQELKENNDPQSVTVKEAHYIYMAAQVADAMAHMEQINAVHRDLAARNCLINSQLTVKVADLGYATQLSTCVNASADYYNVMGKAIPVRWTSPEVLKTQKYSVASDVWAYGILLWEILTACQRPYSDFCTDKEVIEAITGGVQLQVPAKYTDKVTDLITSCWELDPTDRPSFKEVFEQIRKMLLVVYNVSYQEDKDQLDVEMGML